jgi:cytochrome c553
MSKWNILLLGLVMAMGVQAGPEDRQRAQQLIDDYIAERGGSREAARKNPSIDISSRTIMCSACHGRDGNSVKPDIPSLADQNVLYFVEQFLIFQRQGRYPELMHGFADQFTEKEAVALALHYSALPRKVNIPVDMKKAKRGKPLYDAQCAGCHGKDGRGNGEVFASIHAQRPDYLTLTLQRYRDSDEDRRSHEMEGVVPDWDDQTIEGIAHYIASLDGGKKGREKAAAAAGN